MSAYVNTSVNKALKTGWPVVIIFFSIFGLFLYLWTCRPKGMSYFKTGINKKSTHEKFHHNYVASTFSKVTGSVIHCVAGDGLGIMTAMLLEDIWDLISGANLWRIILLDSYLDGFCFNTLQCGVWEIPLRKHYGREEELSFFL